MPEPIIELKNIYQTFNKGRATVPVLRDINLQVTPLERLCLVGESGCGKTTTGRILSGLLKPTRGSVFFEGKDVAKLKGEDYKHFRRSVQIIHQDPYASLNPTHTIYDILSFPLFRHKFVRSRSQARQRVGELLEMVDLPSQDIMDKYPYQLSGGQRQRVSIARALTTNPKVILADEAVSMVDVSIRIGLLKMLTDMTKNLGVTIVFITHDLAIAKHFSWEDRIGVMYLGRLIEIGPTAEIITNPQHPYTRVLLAAIPEADPEKTRHKEQILLRSEDIPSLTKLPSGCVFHTRCPWYVPGVCDIIEPNLEPIAGTNIETACTILTEGRPLTLYKEA